MTGRGGLIAGMRRGAALVALVALVALMLRIAIPPGFMPEARAGESVRLVICTVHGASLITLDGTPTPAAPAKDKSTGGAPPALCPFAAAGATALPQPFALTVFRFARAEADLVPDTATLARLHAPKPSGARAPPGARSA